jgi:PAS domain-containing protein
VLESIPGLVALLTAAGDVEFVNRQILDYTGQTLDELKHWRTNDTVHRDDLPHVVQVFTLSRSAPQRFERPDRSLVQPRDGYR